MIVQEWSEVADEVHTYSLGGVTFDAREIINVELLTSIPLLCTATKALNLVVTITTKDQQQRTVLINGDEESCLQLNKLTDAIGNGLGL